MGVLLFSLDDGPPEPPPQPGGGGATLLPTSAGSGTASPAPAVGAGNAYATRAITVAFQLAAKGQLITLSGLRVELQVTNAVFPSAASIVMRVNGMTLNDMNALTVAGLSFSAAAAGTNLANHVSVSAGYEGHMGTIFTGVIVDAYPDGVQPDMGFIVVASSVVDYTLLPAKPSTFPGAASADTILSQLAGQLGLRLVNNGVTGSLSNAYYSGSYYDQIRDAVNAFGAYGVIDPVGNRLIVNPRFGGTAFGGVIFSPATGTIGYPKFEQANVVVRTLYDPSLIMNAGDPFTVVSQFTAACNPPDNPWMCDRIDYSLSAQLPGGPWEMLIRGHPKNGVASVVLPTQSGS